MTVPFTIGYSDHQSHGVYEELRKAYNERRSALGHALRYWDASNGQWENGDTEVAAGDKIQNHKFFREIQLWIIENCGYFLDPSVSDYSGEAYIKNISELNTAQSVPYDTAFEYFCREIVGGNLVGSEETPVYEGFGFREWYDEKAVLRISGADFGQMIRCGSDIGESYDTGHARGKVIAKDIGGSPWCVVDDICTCLSALRATKITGTGTGGSIVPKANSGLEKYGEYVEATDYYTGDNTNYDSQTPTAYGDYSFSFKQQSGAYGQYRENGACQVQYYIPPNINALISSANLYYKVKKYGCDFSGFDIISHENAYNYVLSLPYTSSGELISPLILRLSGADFDNELIYQYGGLGFQAYGEAGVSDLIGVALWNFTNGIAWA